MNIELTSDEQRHVVSALREKLGAYLGVPPYSIGRVLVQENVLRSNSAAALAKIDPNQFGPREIEKGDPVKSGGESAVVLGRGRGEFAHRVAIETTDGDVRLAYASQLKVIA